MMATQQFSVRRIAVALILAAAVLTFSALQMGYLDKGRSSVSDATADWLTTKAAVSSVDPYVDPLVLAKRFEVAYVFKRPPHSRQVVHFRPPGAFILLSPLLLLSPAQTYVGTVFASIVFILLLTVFVSKITRVRLEHALLVAPIIMLTSPVIGTFEWGSQSLLIATLITGAWLRLSRTDATSSGIALGVASTLKLFPLLLFLPLIAGKRYRAARAAGITFAVLQAGGLLLPGVNAVRVIRGLQTAGDSWGSHTSNVSLPGLLSQAGLDWQAACLIGFALGAVALRYLWKIAGGFDTRFAGVLIVSIFLSPLAWGHYDASLIPVALWLASKRPTTPLIWTALAVWAIGSLAEWIILLTTVGSPIPGLARAIMISSGRAALLGGLMISAWRGESPDRGTRQDAAESTGVG